MSHVRSSTGLTLVEVLAASLIASVVAGGTMMAFITAARISKQQSNTASAEATGLAQQTLEGIRNKVATDATWFTTLTLNTWLTDTISSTTTTTDSVAPTAKRCYLVKQLDCDGDGVVDPNDCYAVNVTVCWNDMTNCPCP